MRKQEAPAGAPEWVVTYGDMMSLLLTFFILLAAFSELRQEDRYQQAVQSIQEAFGMQVGQGIPSVMIPPEMTPMMRMQQQASETFNSTAGDSRDDGVEGRHTAVRNIRDGMAFTLGGAVAFEEGKAELQPAILDDLLKIANTIRGFNYKIEIRGHTSKARLPADSPYGNHMDLSYARAKAVNDFLVEKGGIQADRIRVTAAGAFEPLVVPAYDPPKWARNSRVEIIVTESLVQEFQGDGPTEASLAGPGGSEAEGDSNGG